MVIILMLARRKQTSKQRKFSAFKNLPSKNGWTSQKTRKNDVNGQSHAATNISISYLTRHRNLNKITSTDNYNRITKEKGDAWVSCITDDSVAILSPIKIDSTLSKWMSMDRIGTAEASTVSSPPIGSDKEHWVHILPVIRNPPI